MAKEWRFYDASGNLRRVKEAYFYDSAGNRRKIKEGYFYDASGNRRQFFAGVLPPLLMSSTTLTAGRTGGFGGFSRGQYGSVSPLPTFSNHPGAALLQLTGNAVQMTFRVDGLTQDPGRASLGKLNISGVGSFDGATSSLGYSFGSNIALWSWNSDWYPEIGTNWTVSCTFP